MLASVIGGVLPGGYGDRVWRRSGRSFADLALAALTYQEVGPTRNHPLPAGYGHVRRDVRVGAGRVVFERAV
ncbi:DUF1990 family protein [Phytohabitans houttuyneae]|uniref:DUF1990 domain-containing protein n=1 Tax=Phytohabitans houttuyneae TaxID=1076126 RepID=A0A6V8K9M8_9ACTN|nr:hypothetical protein Phou_061020 [Phytohabitans houttuyneae]